MDKVVCHETSSCFNGTQHCGSSTQPLPSAGRFAKQQSPLQDAGKSAAAGSLATQDRGWGSAFPPLPLRAPSRPRNIAPRPQAGQPAGPRAPCTPQPTAGVPSSVPVDQLTPGKPMLADVRLELPRSRKPLRPRRATEVTVGTCGFWTLGTP